MKGRIIGREGRNIRAFEAATGVDLIIDDTPEAVVVCVLRPGPPRDRPHRPRALIARRPHPPGRIEEVVAKAQQEVESNTRGRRAGGLRGRRATASTPRSSSCSAGSSIRTSYGQNVLEHSMEVGVPLRHDRRRARPRRQAGARARRCCMTSARRSRTRWKARTRISAPTRTQIRRVGEGRERHRRPPRGGEGRDHPGAPRRRRRRTSARVRVRGVRCSKATCGGSRTSSGSANPSGASRSRSPCRPVVRSGSSSSRRRSPTIRRRRWRARWRRRSRAK